MKMTVYERPNGELYVAPDGAGGDKPVKVFDVDTSSGVTAANASIDSSLAGYSRNGYLPRLRILSLSPFAWAACVATAEPPEGWWESGEAPDA